MNKSKKELTRDDFVKWGADGGKKSKRTLTSEQAKKMVAVRIKNRSKKIDEK